MKTLILSLFLIAILSPFAYADTQIGTGNIEIGESLPGALACIVYNGHNATTMQLTFNCTGLQVGIQYLEVAAGVAKFEFDNECYYLKTVGYGLNQVQLWQPSKCTL